MSKLFNVRLTLDMLRAIDRAVVKASKNRPGLNRSDVVREAIARGLESFSK